MITQETVDAVQVGIDDWMDAHGRDDLVAGVFQEEDDLCVMVHPHEFETNTFHVSWEGTLPANAGASVAEVISSYYDVV